ncbi:helix-turn-helix domain-containing protein [Lactobacillus kefiranofaciens]|uniref:helix-turn-helix transcriptional regulator n=1 Tax=Lactobacillus kefiranofaciens TaxID=267818 RepID=UPI002469C58F|nr:helix-turn-helix transcriptional regulator [Lactobacillus kefiranofaciens]MDH5100014.1 helix-turn-helix domain-containing protein [Lactobacillus kefiranofaciens]
MKNNLQKLRKQNKLSQNDLAKLLGVTRQAVSLYEQGKRQLKQKDINTLTKYFNVSKNYLLGAYSREEILAMLQESYSKATRYYEDNYYKVQSSIAFNVDLIMIANGEIEPNEPYLIGMLSPDDVIKLEFWQNNFSFIFNSVAINWLISRPIGVTKEEVLKAINEALQIEISKLSTDTRERTNEYGERLESPSYYLAKRQEFINDHITDDGTLNLDS